MSDTCLLSRLPLCEHKFVQCHCTILQVTDCGISASSCPEVYGRQGRSVSQHHVSTSPPASPVHICSAVYSLVQRPAFPNLVKRAPHQARGFLSIWIGSVAQAVAEEVER